MWSLVAATWPDSESLRAWSQFLHLDHDTDSDLKPTPDTDTDSDTDSDRLVFD